MGICAVEGLHCLSCGEEIRKGSTMHIWRDADHEEFWLHSYCFVRDWTPRVES